MDAFARLSFLRRTVFFLRSSYSIAHSGRKILLEQRQSKIFRNLDTNIIHVDDNPGLKWMDSAFYSQVTTENKSEHMN